MRLHVAGAAPLRFSRVRVFGTAARFISSIDSDQSRSAQKWVTHGKNRTLENCKGAAPTFSPTVDHTLCVRARPPIHFLTFSDYRCRRKNAIVIAALMTETAAR